MANKTDRLSPENVAILAARIFAQPVERITAPGGASRESLRVHFSDRTIIATQRKYPGRMQLEAEVLKRLSAAGAPVPRFLSGTEKLFFQEDGGQARLSAEMAQRTGKDRLALAGAAIESLCEIHAAGAAEGLDRIVPALGEQEGWTRGFVGTIHETTERFGLDLPALDLDAIMADLHVAPMRFLKWDARPGNASVGEAGRVIWFDWEHCGKRQGAEDFAWMMGDEFWPLAPQDMLPILEAALPAEKLNYLRLFTPFHIMQRLTIIHRLVARRGWLDAQKALAEDKIGAVPELAVRLATHGAEWAGLCDLTRPMAPWFKAIAEIAPSLEKRTITNG